MTQDRSVNLYCLYNICICPKGSIINARFLLWEIVTLHDIRCLTFKRIECPSCSARCRLKHEADKEGVPVYFSHKTQSRGQYQKQHPLGHSFSKLSLNMKFTCKYTFDTHWELYFMTIMMPYCRLIFGLGLANIWIRDLSFEAWPCRGWTCLISRGVCFLYKTTFYT